MFRTLSILLLVIYGSSAMAATAPTTPTFVLSWGNFGYAPAQFYSPREVAVDALGNVYVADLGNSRIQKFDRLGNFLTQWGSYGSGDGQLHFPSGVATDAAGNVYVADTVNQRIQKFTNTGTYLTQWGSPGSGPGQFDLPTYVATDAAGNVYVLDGDSRIQKFTNTGTFLTQWGSVGTASRGMATDAAGNVYVAVAGSNCIKKFTSDGTYLTQWGSYGSGDGQFHFPWDVATDATGNVYVADNENHRIQKFTSDGTYLTQWGSLGSGDGQFSNPTGVATDAAGNVYVEDNNRIQKFSGAGAPLAEPAPVFLLKWGSPGGNAGQFGNAFGVAVDGAGNVYVADQNNNRIQKFTSAGTYLAQWGSNGTGDGQFNSPRGVATDAAGNVYVADSGNNRIQKFTADGTYLTQWGSTGTGPGQFGLPLGLGTDAASNVYIADLNDRIQKFTSDGTYLTQWGSQGSGPGQFIAPTYVATDAAGNVYVADQANDRIQKFSSTGTYLMQWGSNGTGDGQFNRPYGVATDATGNVYVADLGNNRIQKFTSAGTYLTQWGSEGNGDGQFSAPYGMATDAAGNVYVADTANNRIQKFTSPPSIALISDIGNDQGRQAQIRFLRTSADAPGSGAMVTGYEIYRRNDPLPGPTLAGRRDARLEGPAAASPSGLSPTSVQLAGWTYLITAPAHGESEYNVVVPTLVDATSASLEYSAFMVRAATTDPFTFYDSGVEYGFSVDNLSPPAPTPFTAAYASGATHLHWGVSPADDFATFKLYRGSTGDFMPGSDNLIGTTAETSLTDVGPVGSFYKLSAVDRNGNEGPYAVVGPGQTTDVPTEPAIVLTFALEGALSNPLPRGQMAVRFTLPTGERAVLELLDVRGRLVVARDVGSMGAGRHAVELSAGRRLASGVYFVRLTQGAKVMVVRQVVLN